MNFKIGDKICPKYGSGIDVYEIVWYNDYEYKVKYPNGTVIPWNIPVTNEMYILKEILNSPLMQALEEEDENR